MHDLFCDGAANDAMAPSLVGYVVVFRYDGDRKLFYTELDPKHPTAVCET